MLETNIENKNLITLKEPPFKYRKNFRLYTIYFDNINPTSYDLSAFSENNDFKDGFINFKKILKRLFLKVPSYRDCRINNYINKNSNFSFFKVNSSDEIFCEVDNFKFNFNGLFSISPRNFKKFLKILRKNDIFIRVPNDICNLYKKDCKRYLNYFNKNFPEKVLYSELKGGVE